MCGQRYAVPALRVAHAPRVHGQADTGAFGNGSVPVVRGHGTARPPRCFRRRDDDHTEDLTAAIVHEKLRIASGLNDEVVSHLFAAAFRLDGALAMTHGPLRQCLTEAIDHVDAGIHAIRKVAFGLAAEHKQDHWGPARHRRPRQDGPD